ncbi:Tetratricopeptide repeat protein 5 [Clydaea vesicula]|uniref:Tetratricopeptide repeat protein 5 n=1 Tax=Clydaea vesicula TaxID=447962 RepID=A0AAD5U8G2_9FUNG|nr:Tetratricopeptide repeat protein 5 [Clydaea vesicula]
MPTCIETEFTRTLFTTPSFDFDSHSEELKALVDELYCFRDNFWIDYKKKQTKPEITSQLQNVDFEQIKSQCLKLKQENILNRMLVLTTPPKKRNLSVKRELDFSNNQYSYSFDPTLSQKQKSFYHYIRGKLFNIFGDYNVNAELDLSKSIKYDPLNTDAWNSMGEVYWKKGDLEHAKLCFEGGLREKKTVEGLLNLAMILRVINKGKVELYKGQIEKSLTLSKEAVEMNIEEKNSWYGLGSSYLKKFFDLTRNSKDLMQALTAYNKAIHHYLENYESCFKDLEHSLELDPGGNSRYLLNSISNYLQNFYRGYLKSKEINYDNFKSTLNKITKKNFLNFKNLKKINDLDLGINVDSFISLKLIKEFSEPVNVHRSFICVDLLNSLNTICLTVYDVKYEALTVGDEMLIGNPNLLHINFNFNNKLFNFKSIRADIPLYVSVNEKKLIENDILFTTIGIEIRAE